MIAMVIAVQVALPLALLLWLAFLPAASSLGLALQVSGVGTLLLALALVAQWAVVPWWLPLVYGGLWATSALWHVLRGNSTRKALLPTDKAGWAGVAFAVMLLGIGAGYTGPALKGRALPAAPVVDIENPFGPGHYLVGSGGSREIVNAHMRTLDSKVERYRPWRGQSYAIDFFGLGSWGVRARGWRPADPASYAIFGAELYAPCAGIVVAVESGMPDFDVPNQDPINRLGNHVILRCDDADIVFAHMRYRSTTVSPGEYAAVGDRLGEVGNSGASTEPHLHIHAQRPAPDGAPRISGEPLALRIEGRFLVRGDRLSGMDE